MPCNVSICSGELPDFFPAIAMASHISAAPNHQTFRTIPLKYRIDVAMSGRLGMEIQPKNMTEERKGSLQECHCRVQDHSSRSTVGKHLPPALSL